VQAACADRFSAASLVLLAITLALWPLSYVESSTFHRANPTSLFAFG
jgi:hypothetical protein